MTRPTGTSTIHVLGLTGDETRALCRRLPQAATSLPATEATTHQSPREFARFISGIETARVVDWLRTLPDDAGFVLRGTDRVLFVSAAAMSIMEGGHANHPMGGVLTEGDTPGLLTHDEMQNRLRRRKR